MIVKSGETAVLGGLLTRTEAEVERGIPGLKAIPVIKWLFTVKEKQSSLQNLVVFMTPRIIFNSDDIAIAIKDAMREYRGKLESDWKDMFPEDMLPASAQPASGEATEAAATEEH